MGILDFIKKIIGTEEIVKNEKEKIIFSKIGDLVETKMKEIENREKEIFISIQKKVSFLEQDINGGISSLKNFDVKSKKAEDKFKSLTEEGREKYIEFVESLLEDLKKIKQNNLKELTEQINKIFFYFNKSAGTS